jgi:hypothetical protein
MAMELPPIASPDKLSSLKAVVQGQTPEFCTRQVLVNCCPGVIFVPSGMVTSEIKVDWVHSFLVGVARVGGVSVGVTEGIGLGAGESVNSA